MRVCLQTYHNTESTGGDTGQKLNLNSFIAFEMFQKRQKSNVNETISFNDVRTVVKGPAGTQPKGNRAT